MRQRKAEIQTRETEKGRDTDEGDGERERDRRVTEKWTDRVTETRIIKSANVKHHY